MQPSCCHGLAVSAGRPAHVHVFLCVLFLTSLPPCLLSYVFVCVPPCQFVGVIRPEEFPALKPATPVAHLLHKLLLITFISGHYLNGWMSFSWCWDIELVKPRILPEILLSCISWIGHWPSRLVLAGFGEECVTGAERVWNWVLELFACHGPRAGSRSWEHVHRSHVIQIGSKYFAASAQLTSFSDGGDRTQCLPQSAFEVLREVRVEDLMDQGLCQAFLVHP